MTEYFELGAYLKQYRMQRHISLRAVASESASTLSRFENEQTRMGGERLRSVMEREGVRYWDLQQHSLQFLSPFKQLVDQLYVERFNLRSAAVVIAIHDYNLRTADESGKLVQIVGKVTQAIQSQVESGRVTPLTTVDQKMVQNILFQNRDWMIFDYDLLWTVAPYLNSKVLTRVFKRAVVQQKDAMPVYRGYFARVFERVSLILLCRHDSEVFQLCAPFLSMDKLNYFDGEDNFTLHFLQIMFAAIEKPQKQARLRGVYAALETLELNQMLDFFVETERQIFAETM
jgi:transcriptional regulator with XRE-family HTH domain